MLLQLGVATHASGDQALARSYLDEAVALTARAGQGLNLGFALLVSGEHAHERGVYPAARDLAADAVDLSREVGDPDLLAGARAQAI